MERFVPYEKLGKKQRRALDARRRGSWGGLNPVTRKPQNPKAYNRKKAQQWKNEPPAVPFLFKLEQTKTARKKPRRFDLNYMQD